MPKYLLLAVALALSACTTAQRRPIVDPAAANAVDPSRLEAIQPLIRTAIANGKLPGAVVLVGLGEFRVFAADQALGGENRVARVGDGLALGGLADEALAALGEGHHRRGGTGAFGVFEDHGFASVHDGHTGVGGAEVDAEDLGHGVDSFLG